MIATFVSTTAEQAVSSGLRGGGVGGKGVDAAEQQHHHRSRHLQQPVQLTVQETYTHMNPNGLNKGFDHYYDDESGRTLIDGITGLPEESTTVAAEWTPNKGEVVAWNNIQLGSVDFTLTTPAEIMTVYVYIPVKTTWGLMRPRDITVFMYNVMTLVKNVV